MFRPWKRFSQRICDIQIRMHFTNIYVSILNIFTNGVVATLDMPGTLVNRRASAAAHSYSPPETLRPHPPEPPHRRPRRRPLILFTDTFLNPTGAALPTPSSTLPELLRRQHRQPHRSSFTYTIFNPTGASLPTHKSTASDLLPRTLIQPTGAASDGPSTATDPHCRHRP